MTAQAGPGVENGYTEGKLAGMSWEFVLGAAASRCHGPTGRM